MIAALRPTVLLLSMLAFLASCNTKDEAPDVFVPDDHGGAPETHPNTMVGVPHGVIGGADSISAPASSIQPGALASVHAAPVEGFTGPDGKAFEVTLRTPDPAASNARMFGTKTMRNSMRERSANVGQYPCTSCHLGRGMVLNDDRIVDAHRNIKPVHPERTGAFCSTCHAADNVELLTLKTGERATLDHTYRLCAQCHIQQATSWAGGAHGKRLDGWQGRRVVMGCADCHDPHSPSIESRIPFRAPQLERVRRR
jgi:hypothetical protein